MRKLTAGALALSFVAVSCGARGDQPEATSSNESAISDGTLPPVEPAEPAEAIDNSGEHSQPLSIDDALLLETDAPAPWSPQGRNVDRFAYDIGANQTDCAPYWEYEQLTQYPGGDLLWWRDGGNLNNLVHRVGNTTGPALIDVFADLPTSCAVTSWSEGDFFTIEALDLNVEGVVGLSFVDASDDTTWLAFSTHGDLLGQLRLTLWPEFETDELPAFTVDDFAATATLMRDRLRAAGPDPSAQSNDPGVTTLPDPNLADPTLADPTLPELVDPTRPEPELVEPGTNPNATTTLPLPEISNPDTTTTAPLPTIPPATIPPDPTDPTDLGGLAPLLLTAEDLEFEWLVRSIEPYGAPEADAEPIDGCQFSASLALFDQAFRFESELFNDGSFEVDYVTQWIGEFPTADDAVSAVELFTDLEQCDIGDLLGPAQLTSTPMTVPGADRAAIVSITYDFEGETAASMLAVAVVNGITTSVNVNGESLTVATGVATDLITRAVAKIVADTDD